MQAMRRSMTEKLDKMITQVIEFKREHKELQMKLEAGRRENEELVIL